MDKIKENVAKAIETYGNQRYLEGLEEGLRVAERICDWLTIQPPRKYAQTIREWGMKAILEARKAHDLGDK